MRERRIEMSLGQISDGNDFECPVCFEVPKPPLKIFQCSNGHSLCELCLGMLEQMECPMCREDFTVKEPIRNRYLEDHMERKYGPYVRPPPPSIVIPEGSNHEPSAPPLFLIS